MRILIIEDEKLLADSLKALLEQNGFEADAACDGKTGEYYAALGIYDLLILDVMMPVLDGHEALRAIRTFSDVPVLMLSARGEEYDKVRGFKLGVDDYVVKPFSPKELMLRVAAILKRGGGDRSRETLGVAGLVVDPAARRVTVDGREVDMTPKEFDLLALLTTRPGEAITRQELLDAVWAGEQPGSDRTLDTHIKQVRRAVGPYAQRIVTLRGVGYRFEEK